MDIIYKNAKYTPVVGMSRGTIVLDENVENLREALQGRNIRVVMVPKGTPDEKIMEELIPDRIFLTLNGKDFEDQVADFEFGLIILEQAMMAQGEKQVAKKISEAMTEHSIWSLRRNFILRLYASGKSDLKRILP